MLSGHLRRAVPALLVACAVAACTSQPGSDETPAATPSQVATSGDPSPTAQPSPHSSPTATAGPTEDPDTEVLAGQFTAFVGADGSGPACDAFWWAAALGGQPYVGLSDTRNVTAAGRVEPLCLLGFDGVVELTVTDPSGEVETFDLDATEPDGGIGVLEVALARTPSASVLLAAWQAAPGPDPTSVPSPVETAVVAQDATTEPSVPPSEVATDDPTTATEDPTTTVTDDPTTSQTEFDETEDVQDGGGVRLDWAIPVDARGEYTFVAQQDDRVAESAVTVLAPTRLEVGPEAEGTRTVTMREGPAQPAPVGVYRIEDEFGSFVDADGFRGRDFVLVEDLGTVADGATVVVVTADLDPGRYCVTSPAVEFVDCRPDDGSDVVAGSGWSQ